MSLRMKIFSKILIVVAFFISGIYFLSMNTQYITNDFSKWIQVLLNPSLIVEHWDMKEQLSLLTPLEQVANQQKIHTVKPFTPVFTDEGKRKIYIYNTHQAEGYADDTTVVDASVLLVKKLEEKGFLVVYETNDFEKEAQKMNQPYNQRYSISRKYLNEALVNYAGFDLIIDFHRDSTDPEVTKLEYKEETYAKFMFVVGMGSDNANTIMQRCLSLTDKMNAKVNGIMRPVFKRSAVYNQDMSENMVLLEVGSESNTIDEINRTLDILAQVIEEEYQ